MMADGIVMLARSSLLPFPLRLRINYKKDYDVLAILRITPEASRSAKQG